MSIDDSRRVAGFRTHALWKFLDNTISRSTRTLRCLVLLGLVGAAFSSAQAATQYRYDDLGRLINVINPDGSVIDYQYDANGNATLINRIGSQTLSIVAVSPTATFIGSTVTVYGAGFSAVPNQNTVTIGGAAAPVNSSTNNMLVVTVPPVAVTGPVTVTVGGVTATSAQIVSINRPAITGFSPTLVNPGNLVTVLGANLNLVPGGTSVTVGGSAATINSITNAQVVFAAPSESGFIAINTSYGQATAAAPLTVIPAAISPANVLAIAELSAAGGSQSVNVNTANKYGIFKFDATQGQLLSIQVSSLTTAPAGAGISYKVYSPTGAQIAASTVSATSPSIHLPAMPATGTYVVSLTSSTATFQLTASLEVNAVAPVDGAPLAVATTVPAQTKRLTFAATAGENLGLGISNLVKTNGGSNGYVYVSVYKPDGSMWISQQLCYPTNGGCDVNIPSIPTTGVYGVLVYSSSPTTEANLVLSFTATVSHDQVTAVTPSTPTAISLTRRGQNGRVTFQGTVGDTVAVQIGGISTVPVGKTIDLTVLKPDGTTLQTTSTAGGTAFRFYNLAATGTYTLLVDPQYGVTANLTVMVVPGNSVAAAVDGASLNISTAATPGAYAFLTFAATAGENLGLGISNLVKTNGGSNGYVYVSVYKPDGSMWISQQLCYPTNGGCDVNIPSIPTTGVYGVLVYSSSPTTEANLVLSFTATVSHDQVTAVTPSTPTAISLTRRGQNGRVTFQGTVGDTVAVQIGGISTVPVGKTIDLTVLKPDGTTLQTTSTAGGTAFRFYNLAATGTYTLLVDPQYGVTANLTVMVVPGNSVAAAVDGASLNISTAATPGAYAFLTFAATAGENLGLGISNLVKTNGGSNGYVYVSVYKPDGSMWISQQLCYPTNGGCDVNIPSIPTTGVYGVLVYSSSPTTEANLVLSFTATVSRDLVVTPAVNVITNVSLSRSGQNARITFSGTAGGAMGVQVGGIVATPAGRVLNLKLLNPDGTTQVSTATATGTTFRLANLPATGTYTLFVDPDYGATTTLIVRVVPTAVSAVVVDGVGNAINTTGLPGTYGYFTFAATAGENLGLGISNLTRTNGSASYPRVTVDIYKPDGSSLESGLDCNISTAGCGTNMAITSAGIHSVIVRSPSPTVEPNLTMSFTGTVSHDLVVAPPVGTPAVLNLSLPGQNARATFAGTAASTMTVQITGVSTTPSGRTVSLKILKPDGTTLASATTSVGYTFNLTNLPTTGTYTLVVDPQYGATATMQVTRP